MSETYIYKGPEDVGIEVVKTGRDAVRYVQGVGKGAPREMILVEIQPVDKDEVWRKWIDPTHLYVIR